MKINRRKAGVFVLSGVVVAAAIAIPIGIVYGTSKDTTAKNTEFDYSKDTTKNVNFTYGTPLSTPTAPALAAETGYTASQYSPGVYDKTTFTPADGVDGNKTATITYKYVPLNSGDPIVYVTYTLNVSKGTPKDLSTFVSDQGTIPYGETALPKVNGDNDINALLYAGGYGYKGVNSATNPKYVTSTGAAFTAADLATLAVGQTFKVQYDATYDAANYVDADAAHPATKTFEFVYTIAKRTVTPPSVTTNPDAQLVYNTPNYAFVAPQAADHYVAAATPVAVITARSSTASANTPAVGANVVEADVPKYDVGTVFTVTYTYSVEDATKYDGPQYTFTTTTTITAEAATRPTEANSVLAETTYDFAKAPAEFGTGTVKTQPAAPVYNGYVADATVVAKVKTASSVTTGNSPAKDADVVWADVNSYNSGTKFEVVYSYKAAPNYSGDPFTITQPYSITKAKVAIPVKTQNPENTTGYDRGADPAALVAPTADAHFTLTDTKYFLGTSADATKSRTADQIKTLTGDEEFTVQWTYTLDSDNYEPASGTAMTYTETTAFKVVASTASYTGLTTYPAAEIEFSNAFPTATFVPSDLPEPTKNTGYKYDSAAYKVTKAAKDPTLSPAVNAPAVVADVNTYGAGTEITATFTFKADAPTYKGADKTATKVLTIKEKPVTKPADITLTPVNLNYGATTAQPTAEPKTFAGFKGAYTSAVFAKHPASGTGSGANDTVSWPSFKEYAVGTEVTVNWTYTPDVNHSGSPFTTTQTYSVTGKPTATEPTTAQKTLADVVKPFGTTDLATLPPNPNESIYTANGYVLDGTPSAKVDTQSPNTDTTNGQMRPAKNAVVTWADVTHYNAGTVFILSYTYKPDSNHTGTPFTVTQKYTITTAPKTAEPTSKVLPAVSLQYGANKETSAPANPNGPALGYKLSTTATKVTVQGIEAKYGATRPAVDDPVVWGDVATYSPNTKFVVTYTYVNDDNHQTATYAVTKEYTITKATLGAAPTDLTADDESIEFGKNTYASTPGNPNAALTSATKDDYNGYVLLNAVAKVTKQSTLTEDADHLSPARDTVVDWSLVAKYNTDTQFTVTYSYKADDNHEGTTTFNVTKLFTITPTDAPTVPATKTAPAGSQVVGSTTTPANPNVTATPADYNGFVLKSTTAKVTKASTRDTDATHVNPAKDAVVDWTKVGTYNADTEFTVTYTYENDGNHKAASFTVTQPYKITAKTTTRPANPTIPASNVSYGTTTSANGNVALPTETTAQYASSNFTDAVGYDNGTASMPTVTKRSTTKYTDPANNLVVGPTTWTAIQTANASTEFESTLTYAPTNEYDGPTFTVVRHWTIVQQKVTVSGLPSTGYEFNYGNFKQGDDATKLPALTTDTATQNAGNKVNRTYFLASPGDPQFYTGPNGSPNRLTAAQVSALPVGQTFIVYTYFVTVDNYLVNNNPGTNGQGQTIIYHARFTVVAP